jgi:YidC/Oxa1 family membrane protein insertase
LVLIGWQYLNPPPPLPPAPESIEAPASPPPGPGTVEPRALATPPTDGSAVASSIPAPDASTAADPGLAQAARPESAEREERRVVEGAHFRAEFTNRGAQLLSFQLMSHVSADGGPVDLVRTRAEGPYPFALRAPGGTPSPLNEALFVVDAGSAGEAEWLEFRYSGPAGRATKRFQFREDGLIDVVIEVAAGGEVLLGPGIGNPAAQELENRFNLRSGLYRTTEDLERVRPEKAGKPTVVTGAAVRWAGIDDTYFLTAFTPSSPVGQISFEPVVLLQHTEGPTTFAEIPPNGEVPEELRKLDRELRLAIRLSGDRLEGVSFWGAKDFDRLAALPYGFEESVRLGFFGVLAKPLLWGLQWIHDHVVDNYGWAIILMTILIRILLFPLTHKSFVSMQKMQELNPQLQSIRARYRPKLKDKQGRAQPEMQRKMNEEIMALYRKEGVNPAGGCLPMLLQIPVLFAFYSLLSTAIALRQAPWIFWIADLSAKDPYYVLPIVMGASQFVQQKLTPAASDPMQRRMFMMMPIFFTVLFLGFPSGLVLYWLTNNLLGIAQQAAYKRIRERKAQEAEGVGAKPGGKKGKTKA